MYEDTSVDYERVKDVLIETLGSLAGDFKFQFTQTSLNDYGSIQKFIECASDKTAERLKDELPEKEFSFIRNNLVSTAIRDSVYILPVPHADSIDDVVIRYC